MTKRTLVAAASNQDGIAIGPILFIVAILAILATAIAAGSSTFATSSGQETNRTNAAAMISLGQNLKMGVDRIVALGTPLSTVDINAQNTTQTNSLFSLTGGGLVPPATTLANNPATDQWIYTWGQVTNMGTTSLERIAALHVTQGVCDQVNTQVGNFGTPAGEALGNISNTVNFSAWPAAPTNTGDPNVIGKMIGCVNNSNPSANTYYFYQVIGVQ
jgi:hypothetical protein